MGIEMNKLIIALLPAYNIVVAKDIQNSIWLAD